jgi:hypothetical protein
LKTGRFACATASPCGNQLQGFWEFMLLNS